MIIEFGTETVLVKFPCGRHRIVEPDDPRPGRLDREWMEALRISLPIPMRRWGRDDRDDSASPADLDYRKWQVELNFIHINTTMKMDVVRCETVEGVLKELAVSCLAYNLVRSSMVESARLQGVAADRVSLVDAVRWLIGVEEADASVLVANPRRPGRVEPRVVKRRPKQSWTRRTARTILSIIKSF